MNLERLFRRRNSKRALLRAGALVALALFAYLSAPGAAFGMIVTKNIPYVHIPGVKLNLTSLDIYAPDDANPRNLLPVMIYIHGGAWSMGDKSQVNLKPTAFTSKGYIFVSVNYRLTTSKIKFPTHAYDIAKAVAWIYSHGSVYFADPRKIFLMGHSAGCHLVAIVATDSTYLKAEKLSLKNILGVIDLDTQAYDLPRLAQGYGGQLPEVYTYTFGDDPAGWASASPIAYVKSGRGIPPQIVAYSGGIGGVEDTQRKEQSEAYFHALGKAHIMTQLVPAPNKTHAQINLEFGKAGDPVTQACFAFLARILKGTI